MLVSATLVGVSRFVNLTLPANACRLFSFSGKTALTLGGATVGAFQASPGSFTSHGDVRMAELRLWKVALSANQLGMCVGRTAECKTVSFGRAKWHRGVIMIGRLLRFYVAAIP